MKLPRTTTKRTRTQMMTTMMKEANKQSELKEHMPMVALQDT